MSIPNPLIYFNPYKIFHHSFFSEIYGLHFDSMQRFFICIEEKDACMDSIEISE